MPTQSNRPIPTPAPQSKAGGIAPAKRDALPSALLLAATGGLLDASVYTLHGHVFANAMTGNAILLGISVFGQDWMQALRHFVPICAFLIGVGCSRLLRVLPQFYASITVLVFEMTVLAIAGLLQPSFPEMAFTAIIAFVSAFQVSTFRMVGRFTYNSTFITGNLRDFAESFIGRFVETGPDERRRNAAKATKLFIICTSFVAGAVLGAWGAPHLGNRTLWLTEPMLLIVLARVAYLHEDSAIP